MRNQLARDFDDELVLDAVGVVG
jgi:hypothetical protein